MDAYDAEPEHNSVPYDIAFDAGELQFLLACVGRLFFAAMATATNSYAAFCGAGASWHDTTENEMRFFVGTLILMGINRLPEYRDFVCSRITRNRYEQLMQYLHHSDRAAEDRADKLGKVRPLLTHLQRGLPQLFTPGVALSLDEAMIKFNGRLSWKQYMPKKPIKWGVKLWVLSDASLATAWRLTSTLGVMTSWQVAWASRTTL